MLTCFCAVLSALRTEMDVRNAVKKAQLHRHSSPSRFTLLVDSVFPPQNPNEGAMLTIEEASEHGVKFFMVEPKSSNSIDVVSVFSNGSFACTDPTFANYGTPRKHIIAVFVNGDAFINAGMHYNMQ
jgi:hypothetical protein